MSNAKEAIAGGAGCIIGLLIIVAELAAAGVCIWIALWLGAAVLRFVGLM